MSTGTETDGTSSTEAENCFPCEEVVEAFFPYDSPYEDQWDGIENTLQTFYNDGFHLMEGPCGTGKTLIALNAAMGAIRDPKTKFKRALVITSVKQQQKAFEHDIKQINESIINEYGHRRKAPDKKKPIDSLTIVGKRDLCPYVDSGAIDGGDISGECSTLKKSTYDASDRLSAHDNSLSDGANKVIESGKSTDEDQSQQRSIRQSKGTPTHTEIDDTPYLPHPVGQHNSMVCPYYAQAIIDDEKGTQTMKYSGMMDAATLRNKSAQLGTCPYEVMKDGIDEAEIIIGNYAHAVDSMTVQATTQQIVDESTILIVDEAHMLIERARDQLSRSMSRDDLETAITAIETLENKKRTLTPRVTDEIKKELRQAGTSLSEMGLYKELFKDLLEFVDITADTYCNRQHSDSDSELTHNEEIPLRDPESTGNGQLMMWMQQAAYNDRDYEQAKYKTMAFENAINILTNNTDVSDGLSGANSIETIGSFLTKKFYSDETDYFTKIDLTTSQNKYDWNYDPTGSASGSYDVDLVMENCIPAYDLASKFDKFGAGLIMSATLSPTDITSQIIGLNILDRYQDSDSFELGFPEENRGSYTVKLEKFTYDNRGDAGDNNRIRKKYKQAIEDVVTTTRGNTLICTPSYGEAKWVGNFLDENTEIPVYIDESSSNDETTQMKQEFTSEQKAVLCTSLRGTLTEGVDYDGDDLLNVIVVGVPIADPTTYHAKAIRNSFTLEFGKRNAFDYSFRLPAIFKTRQALGRVIRSDTDVGLRFLMDNRYTNDNTEHSFLTSQQQAEYKEIDPQNITDNITDFWDNQD
jgi:DNA excision repair protein ERCC-2